MNQFEIAKQLNDMALLMELKGENPFKIRAFKNGSQALESLGDDFHTLIAQQKITDIKGIGKGLAADIYELYETGKLDALEKLREEFPSTLFELFAVPQLGPKKIKVLFDVLKISSLVELEYACEENQLIDLKGFGEKTQDKIRKGIAFLKKTKGQYLYAEVIDEVQRLIEKMQDWREIEEISLAGSLRRKKETVKDADIVCASSSPEQVMKKFTTMEEVGSVLNHGSTKSSVILVTGLQVDLRVVTSQEYPYTLHHFTGSKEHNTEIRSMAKKMGLKVNEYGVFKGEEKIPCKDEREFFSLFSMSYVEPELREGRGEISLAKQGDLPDLIELEDVKGFFHMHSTYSDGRNSLEEMIQEAHRLGMSYVGVSDHSQTAVYSKGLKEQDIDKQHREIDELQKRYPDVRIFKGIESDILNDGSLDYPERVLKKFDFVIASVHSNFSMTEEAMTRRCIAAISNPYCTMLGHPTGRLLLGREGFAIDLPSILEAAANYNKVVELNANPHRLDLDWRMLDHARKHKVKVSINPDAHSVEGISHLRFGIAMARKGMLTKHHVLNTLDTSHIEQYLAK
ncbi:MAG: DNA polymerase/3'-5' exonuclease PolX [Bdellovibrionota bacterium]